ncbi:MAG: MBL fold metallo-hydrolase [Chitinophagales bacterium]|nr:MBL fold metallo-hydrolase [Chitinophagales bacterium]
MKISIVETGNFKLDGGAMFGVVPQKLWKRLNPPDEQNMCTWSMRCLLIETGDRKILIDTGIGNKQGEKFRKHFEPHGEASLVESLKALGHDPESITDVLLTHFHFDHVGGATIYNEAGENVPLFPGATYWTNEVHYNWALYPNAREKASFLQENFVPLKEQGILKFIDVQKEDVEWIPGISLRYVYGHTEAMMMPIIDLDNGQQLVYCADLIPSSFHIGMPYVMSYDVRPLDTMREKGRLLEDAIEKNHLLFFEHDPLTACVSVQRDERGRVVMKEKIESIFG